LCKQNRLWIETTMRELIFGAMPEHATPATHLASGPWCFTDREELFPAWEERFPLPPDPFAPAGAMQAAADLANAAMLELIPVFAGELNRARGTARGLVFWETALAPWLLTALHMLAERRQRLDDLAALYGREPLRVALLPGSCAFGFRNSLDFMIHGVQNVAFNHFLFSELLRENMPAAWESCALPPRELHKAAPAGQGLKERLGSALRRLPFPRLKGFSLGQSVTLSLTLWRNRRDNDRTVPLERYVPVQARTGKAGDFARICLPLLTRCLPLDLLEAPLPGTRSRKGRIRVMAGEFLQNETYALQLAAWREGGGRLIDCQHGGNNGNLGCIGSNILDYRQHAHLTWGWTKHEPFPGNFTPVHHPLPCAAAGAHKERNSALILVGTEMSTYTYRLKSRPLAAGLVAYRKAKLTFFASLPEEIRRQAQYRPYFTVAAGLADAPYVHKAFPAIPLCGGELMRALLSCRLAVLDHYGTTMLLALAANVPLICYWDRTLWGMGPETEEKLELLREAGVLQPDAASAARQAARVWNEVPAWWTGEAVTRARKGWVDAYAACSARGSLNLTRHWQGVLENL
jgi:hypothetical protein